MDGFFVAKFKKYSNVIQSDASESKSTKGGEKLTPEEKTALRNEKKRKLKDERKERFEQQKHRDNVHASIVEENSDEDMSDHDEDMQADDATPTKEEVQVKEKPAREKSKGATVARAWSYKETARAWKEGQGETEEK